MEEALGRGVRQGQAGERQRPQHAGGGAGEPERSPQVERRPAVEGERSAGADDGDVGNAARHAVLHQGRDRREREVDLQAGLGGEALGGGRARRPDPDRPLTVEPEAGGEAPAGWQLAGERDATETASVESRQPALARAQPRLRAAQLLEHAARAVIRVVSEELGTAAER